MRAAILLLSSHLLCVAATETVILDNGDRLSGELLKVEEGKLSLKTEYAGVISIAWSSVREVTSSRHFQVEAETGLRLRGPMRRLGGEVEMLTDAGPMRLAPNAVVRLTPTDVGTNQSFWRALEGNIDVGHSFTRGNADISQSSLSLNTRYRRDGYKVQMDVASLLAKQESAQGASRHTGSIRFDRFLSPGAFLYTNAGMERDERRLLNLRTNLGGGLGWKLMNGGERELSLLGGFHFVNEQFRRTEEVQSPGGASGEGQLGVDWRTVAPGGLQFTTKLALTPNIVQLGRYRFALESGARLPLIGRYVWSINIFNRYDSRPPVEAHRTDYGAISSLGVSF